MASNSSISFCPGLDYVKTLGWFLNGPFTVATVCLGFILNMVSGLVFRCLPSNPIQNYLVALTVWDNLLLFNGFLLYGLSTLLYGARAQSGAYVYVYLFSYPFCNVALTATMWITVALTFHRYRVVTNPFGYMVVSTQNHRSKLIVSVVSVVAIIWRLPLFFELTVGECFDEGGQHSNETHLIQKIQTTFLYKNQFYRITYRTVCAILLQSAGPLLLMLVLMCAICLELRHASKVRTKISGSCCANDSTGRVKRGSSNENKDNLLLTCVAVKFFMSRVPPTLLEITETILGTYKFNGNLLIHHLVNISNALVVLNGATNFPLYLIVGSRFRRAFCQMISKRKLTEWKDSEINNSDATELFDRSIAAATGSNKQHGLHRQLMLTHRTRLTEYGTFVRSVSRCEPSIQASAITTGEVDDNNIEQLLDVETRIWVV